MKYTRNQLNKFGDQMLTSKDENKVNEAINIINDWRTTHLIPLDELSHFIDNLLYKKKIVPVLTSKRLKRLTSIQYKLDLNSEMKLGGMQDIGGYRVVLKNCDDLKIAYELINNNSPKHFELTKVYDYVKKPKESGYRSIHFVYKYINNDNNYNGLRIELQIRTKLQHNWATAVETAGLYTETSLKSSQGDDYWLDFFKVVSSLFSLKENLPVMDLYKKENMQSLMIKCHNYNTESNYCNILKALSVTVDSNKDSSDKYEYYILNINFRTKIVSISEYTKDQKEIASKDYSELEKDINDKNNAVVFVSVSKIKELRNAYPSYFLDTKEFFSALDQISKNCKVMGWVK